MRALSAVELLDIWDYGHGQAPAQRALDLLEAAFPEASREDLAALSVGQRDAGLLTLREWLWGPRMAAVVVCPGCRERLEVTLDTREMQSDSQREQPGEIPFNIAEYS